MAITPEGKVKAAVKKYLAKWDCWTDWPVPAGYGKSTLDCLVIANGCVLWIETKAPGAKLTNRQNLFIGIMVSFAPVIVISQVEEEYLEIFTWMARNRVKWRG